jgi:beta-glucosidase
MDMASQTYIHNLPQLVAAGKVPEAQLDEAVMPILEAKYQLGLFDNPYIDESKVEAVLTRPEGVTLGRNVAARSMVLLKNDNHTLPLRTNVKKIAVIGTLADSTADIQGGWTVEGLFGGPGKGHPITVLAGLKNKLGPGVEINYVPGSVPTREYPSMMDAFFGAKPVVAPTAAEVAQWLAKAKAAAADSDVVIAVLGEMASMSSEAASRATLDLPGIQEQMLETVAATGKPVVLVLLNGRPLDIRWAAAHVPAILEAWYPGAEGGDAVADVLFGDVNPGGKLPVSWPRAAGQEPLYYNHNLTHAPEDRADFTSRYWDLNSKPLYPFGYGLSYSTFKFANLHLSKNHISADGSTEVEVDLTNSGTVAGDTVAQIYIHQQAGSASRPVRQLKGFRRVTLKPGETQTLKFTLGKDELSFWSPQTRAWGVEPGGFDIWAGEDSTATLHADLTVTE